MLAYSEFVQAFGEASWCRGWRIAPMSSHEEIYLLIYLIGEREPVIGTLHWMATQEWKRRWTTSCNTTIGKRWRDPSMVKLISTTDGAADDQALRNGRYSLKFWQGPATVAMGINTELRIWMPDMPPDVWQWRVRSWCSYIRKIFRSTTTRCIDFRKRSSGCGVYPVQDFQGLRVMYGFINQKTSVMDGDAGRAVYVNHGIVGKDNGLDTNMTHLIYERVNDRRRMQRLYLRCHHIGLKQTWKR